MSGFLRRLFAPRWQHPDPDVRRQAIARLDPAQDGQRQQLERLVHDPDPGVRRAALAGLSDPERLLALHRQGDGSHELRERLITLLCGREGSLDLPHRIALTEGLDEPDLLERVALEGDNQQLRLAALARLDGEEALIRQACENGIAAVRHAAAARVESERGLTRLTQEARRDRQVIRQARERLNRLRADAASLAEARTRREALLEKLEAHANAAWEPLYAGRFRHLMREWARLDDLPDSGQERRYQDACQRCRKVISDHEAREQAQDKAERHREQADRSREALVEALEESLQALRHGERLADQDIASLRAQKQLLASRWQALSDQHLADDELRRRYDAALAGYEYIVKARVRLDERADAIEQALQQGDDERLACLVEACGWPADLPPSPLLQRAHERLHAADAPLDQDVETRLAHFAEELDALERLLESGAFKGASRLHQRLRHQAETLPAERLGPLRGRLKRLGARLAELRDWRGFVAGPKRDQLCEAITALADDSGLSDAELDRRHRRLVKEWKDLGDAAANREQSAAFRAASDRIHERLADWRDRRQAERQRNLVAREALCEQLETLLAQPAEQADPDALREIRDRARLQWRHHSPVPRDAAEAIGRRFGRIRHALQALIEQRAHEIAEAKRALIEEARTLRDGDQPPARQAEAAKALQQRWRALGRAPKGEEQALWREFRHLCDEIFARRDAARSDQAQRARTRLDAMQALIDRLDAWHPARSSEATDLEAAIQEASTLEPLPPGRRSEGMRRRWSGIVRARRERLARLALAEEVHRWRQVQPLLEAHLAADAASLAGADPTEVPEAEAGPLPEDLRQAHARRNAARRAPPAPEDVDERLARLRVHLSLLAGDPVNRQDDPLRLAIQVERLNENLGREASRADELRGVLADLLATGPVPPDLWKREVGDLDRTLETLTQLPPP
ncbi:DUF349 domain-containing protein [Halomonas nitroreducens]|uniref:DUF349 domain-containing protein n=1 Tax=Halomonas nitroreducens TaxID=447425 RepID=A0A3S0J9N3_9GAMM|nr:DUF349 domain-containing protein [Halomonas nitroreducens]RTR03331.1 DUF349 domain-containing protein [Halomonas nitroreducens]